MVLSVVHIVDCSYIKKLIWLTHNKRQSSSGANSDPGCSPRICGNCATSLSVFGSIIRSGNTCQACRQEVCSKCTVPKKIAMEASSTEMKIKTVTFCVHCVIEAKQLSTRKTAGALLYASVDPECSAPKTI